jgi:hypothetical protein
MTIADLISADPDTGRAVLSVPGYPARILLPCHARDIRAMGPLRQRFAGALTPGETTPSGVFISEALLAIQSPVDIVDLFLHECTHWWQCWRRMGVWSYWATYLWQVVLSIVRMLARHRSLTGVHADQLMEREARESALAMRCVVLDRMRASQPAWFDAQEWLSKQLPAKAS